MIDWERVGNMDWKRYSVLFTLIVIISFGCSKQGKIENNGLTWPMLHKNLARTGSYGKPAVPPLQLKWKSQTDGPIFSSPAVVNGIVYFVSHDSCCYALDAITGKMRWKKQIELGTILGDVSPVVAKGIVFVGKGYALKTETGEIVWHNPKWNSEFSAFVEDTVIYYANSGGGWSEVDSQTGNFLMFFPST